MEDNLLQEGPSPHGHLSAFPACPSSRHLCYIILDSFSRGLPWLLEVQGTRTISQFNGCKELLLCLKHLMRIREEVPGGTRSSGATV